MAEHIVVESVLAEDISGEISVIGEPIISNLLGAKHQH